MYKSFFDSQDYKNIVHKHIYDTVSLLLTKDIGFGVACKKSNITFSPELPSNISSGFGERVFFILSDYSHESARIEHDLLLFEAGFGDENFGSEVSIPLLAIEQIVVQDNPILINYAPYIRTKENPINSMSALLKNPKNKNLLGKKKYL